MIQERIKLWEEHQAVGVSTILFDFNKLVKKNAKNILIEALSRKS